MKFSELDERAQQHALDWYRSGQTDDSSWYQFVYDDAAEVLGFLGFDIMTPERYHDASGQALTRMVPDINFSGFWSQGDGACFRGYWRAINVDLVELQAHAPEDKTLWDIGARLMAIVLRYPTMTATIATISSHYSHSNTMSVEEVRFSDDDDYEYEGYIDQSDTSSDLLDLAREAADWIYDRLRDEHDYLTSDETCKEGIESNDYDFDEEGEIA